MASLLGCPPTISLCCVRLQRGVKTPERNFPLSAVAQPIDAKNINLRGVSCCCKYITNAGGHW